MKFTGSKYNKRYDFCFVKLPRKLRDKYHSKHFRWNDDLWKVKASRRLARQKLEKNFTRLGYSWYIMTKKQAKREARNEAKYYRERT